MKLTDYQKFTDTIVVYDKKVELEYLTLGLVSEAGEVAGVVKKLIRQDCKYQEAKLFESSLKNELGDCLWYISQLCNYLNISFEDLAELNYEKLTIRKSQGTIKGDGEQRIASHVVEAIDQFNAWHDGDTLHATWDDSDKTEPIS